MGLLTTLIVQISAYASIGGLYLTVQPPGSGRPEWHWALISLFLLLAAATIYDECKKATAGKPKVFKSTDEINSYMRSWVNNPGRTVIFSRDLSWGSDRFSKLALKKKAESKDLTICLHHPTALSEELRSLGAKIVIYGKSGHEPRSRFTIVGYGMEGSRVALGVQRGNEHIVYEFGSGEHPTFALAEDLARIISGFESGSDAV